MAIKATPSGDYPIILVPEDSLAFRDHPSAIRELKKQWAAQQPAQRVGYFIAKVESYVEADYQVQANETPVGGGPPPGGGGGPPPGGGGGPPPGGGGGPPPGGGGGPPPGGGGGPPPGAGSPTKGP